MGSIHVRNLVYAFCAGHVFKVCYTCSVVCEIWGCCGVREARLLRKEVGGGGGGLLFESRPWYGKRKIDGVTSRV